MKRYTRIEPTKIYIVGDKFKREAVVKTFQTDDGQIHEFTTMYKEGTRSSCVLALTPDNNVIVSRQFRAGRERYLDDLPGGAIENGETPSQAARRELLEESGYKAGKLTFLGVYSWDGYSNIAAHCFLATDCVPAKKRIFEQIEIDQGLETRLISITQLLYNATHDQMNDIAPVLMAYEELRSRLPGNAKQNKK